MILVIAGSLCLAVTCSCGTQAGTAPPSSNPEAFGTRVTAPAISHMVIVLEENSGYASVVHNTAAWPNLNRLISQGGLATRYYANTHPSIGNYFMMTTGQILTNDDASTKVWNVDNIARQMISRHIYFRIYAEGISRGYRGGDTGQYLLRHNPFALLSDTAGSAAAAYQYIWPFSQFSIDAANGVLPTYSFVIPDAIDDAHSASPYQADQWLESRVVGPLSARPAFQPGGAGLLLVAFDEASTSDTAYGGGHVPLVLWGPPVKPGYVQASSTIYQHQSLLRLIMTGLGLTSPPAAAANAPNMNEFFK